MTGARDALKNIGRPVLIVVPVLETFFQNIPHASS